MLHRVGILARFSEMARRHPVVPQRRSHCVFGISRHDIYYISLPRREALQREPRAIVVIAFLDRVPGEACKSERLALARRNHLLPSRKCSDRCRNRQHGHDTGDHPRDPPVAPLHFRLPLAEDIRCKPDHRCHGLQHREVVALRRRAQVGRNRSRFAFVRQLSIRSHYAQQCRRKGAIGRMLWVVFHRIAIEQNRDDPRLCAFALEGFNLSVHPHRFGRMG